MSFSSDLKQELSQINNLNKKDEVRYELIGYLISKNSSVVKNKIRFATKNDYNINRFSKLLKNLDIQHNIEFDGKSFIITFKQTDCKEEIAIENLQIIAIKKPQNDYERKSVIRGAFLGGGSINNPENKYHIEVNFSNEKNLNYSKEILDDLEVDYKVLETKEKYSIYLKDGEKISEFIALLGANKSVLNYENIRVNKEMRGKVNRIVNCQTANLNKTLNASVEQIEAIKKLQETNKFYKLDDNLKEIANLRIEYPDMSLIELGKMLKKPLGKSGVNYRLKKIIDIANDAK